MCGSQQALIGWTPLESSGQHAETIKGKIVEKAETVTNSLSKGVGVVVVVVWGGLGTSSTKAHVCFMSLHQLCVCVCAF